MGRVSYNLQTWSNGYDPPMLILFSIKDEFLDEYKGVRFYNRCHAQNLVIRLPIAIPHTNGYFLWAINGRRVVSTAVL